VEIPASVEEIGALAFERCTVLTEVIFAANSCLRTIKGFKGCTSLGRVEIPAAVEDIRGGAFAECSALMEVIFVSGSRLRIIDGFGRCASLRRVEIPGSVEEIGASAFEQCTALAEVVFRKSSRLQSVEGFRQCDSLYRLDIPASVENIRSSAESEFGQCGSLEDASRLELILESGTRIGPLAVGTRASLDAKRHFRAFLTFADHGDLARRRARVHLKAFGISRDTV
jgi:hypothetical protein